MPKPKIALLAIVFLALYWLLLFVGTHLPLSLDPIRTRPNTNDDKVAHVLAFAGLAFLLCTTGAIDGRFRGRLVPNVLLICVAYAVADEWSQQFIPGRESTFKDWIADMLGTGIGLSAFLLFGEPLLAALPRSRIPRDQPGPKANALAA
jgi:VanZ family protein